MRNYIILALMITGLAGLIYSATTTEKDDDTYQRCIDRCNDRGYDKKYCLSRCSPATDEHAEKSSLSDSNCMKNCKTARHDDAYCTKACTFY